jgi:hypothetical protein
MDRLARAKRQHAVFWVVGGLFEGQNLIHAACWMKRAE